MKATPLSLFYITSFLRNLYFFLCPFFCLCIMATYFTRAPQQPYCPTTGVDHRTVTTYRCAGCNLRNPNYRARSPIPPDAEVIPIGDDSPNLPTRAPPRPSRSATHLAKVPGLVLGHADMDRQQAIQREADR